MKVESIAEQRERLLTEARRLGTQVPGRTLPHGTQWTGLDQPGCNAAKRRLKQLAKNAPPLTGDGVSK